MIILGTECIIVEILDDIPNIDQLQKHLSQIKKISDSHIVLLCKNISRYRRKSLIEKRIAFVIEDGQMYMPFLGLDLKKVHEFASEVTVFTRSALIAFIYFLYHKEDSINTTDLAQKCGFTTMTASRALHDLYHAGLITYEIGGKTGRSKGYTRIPDPDYFRRGRDYLKSPVTKVLYTKTKPVGALTAGLDALAGLTMINQSDHPVMAIDKHSIHIGQVEIITNTDLIKDAKLVELELWDYNPLLFSNACHVDLLSLYLSLQEETDDKVMHALEELLRGESWYTD